MLRFTIKLFRYIPPRFYHHGILSEGILNFVLEISKLRFMKHFIELTKVDGTKHLVNIMSISYICQTDDNYSRIVLHSCKEKGASIAINIKESYDEIKEMIKSAL